MKKEQVGRSVTAAAVAMGVLTNGAVDSPGALLTGSEEAEKPTTIVAAGSAPEYDLYGQVVLDDEDDWRNRLSRRMLAAPAAVRALVLLPLWGIGQVACQGVSLLMAGLQTPVGTFLASLGVQGLLLLGVFAAVHKLLFPQTPIKELLSRKRFPWLVAGAAAVTAVDTLLGWYWEDWGLVRALALAAAGYGVLLLLWVRLCGDKKPPETPKERIRLTYFGDNTEILKQMEEKTT